MPTPTKAKEETPQPDLPAEEPTEPTPSESAAGLTESIKSFITDTVHEAIDALKPAPREGRKTYKDEEEDMADRVTAKVAELLHREKAQGENHPEPDDAKVPKEPVPAQPSGRRVEKMMGWS